MNLFRPMAAMSVGGVTPMVAQEAVVVMGAILEAAVVMAVEVIMEQEMVTVVAEPNIAR
ncbi:TPA: hypothetical protein U5D21_003362 [Yersinia enterocolitica]|nr:hypothetical protein [Yersinia enterocolitica]